MRVTDCGIIILAAGSSSRLGSPKQLLLLNNKTLLQHSIDEAIASGIENIVVVTGSNHDNIISALPENKVRFVYNENWQEGMASSMQAGLLALLSEHRDLSSIIIMLCDQPFVSSLLLQEMIVQKQSTGKGIVACVYKETIGVPALFSNNYFEALLSLQGSDGAKKIIVTHAGDVAVIPFPPGAIDIDTMEDYEQLIK